MTLQIHKLTQYLRGRGTLRPNSQRLSANGGFRTLDPP